MQKILVLLMCCAAFLEGRGQGWEHVYTPIAETASVSSYDFVQGKGGCFLELQFFYPPEGPIGNWDLVRLNSTGDTIGRVEDVLASGTYIHPWIFSCHFIHENAFLILSAGDSLIGGTVTGNYYKETIIDSDGSIIRQRCIPWQNVSDEASLYVYKGFNAQYFEFYPDLIDTSYYDTPLFDTMFHTYTYNCYDTSQTLIWSYTQNFTGPGYGAYDAMYEPNHLLPTCDGGLVIPLKSLDTIFSAGSDLSDVNNLYLRKVNNVGVREWTTEIGTYLGLTPYSNLLLSGTYATADSGILCTVFEADTSTYGWRQAHLVKLDKYGNIVNHFTKPGYPGITGCFESTNGNIILSSQVSILDGVSLWALNSCFIMLGSELNFQELSPEPAPYMVPGEYAMGKYIPNDIKGAFVMNGYHSFNFDSLFNTFPSAISGNIIYDKNSNCTNDSTDQPFVMRPVHFAGPSGESLYGFTNSYGEFKRSLPYGEFTVSHNADENKITRCPAIGIYSYNVTDDIEYTGAAFYDTLNTGLHNLQTLIMPETFVPGYNAHIRVQVLNAGGNTESTICKVVKPSFMTYLSAIPVPAFIVEDTLTFDITALAPDNDLWIDILVNTEAESMLGETAIINAGAMIDGDASPENNADTTNTVVVGAFDPNDKAVNRPLYCDAAKEFVYKVRFQNTGTYYAKNVLVTDSIDADLDLSTFKLLQASHGTPAITWHEGNRLHFVFNDIYLPDSNADEPGSHGYFTYSLHPKWTTTVGDTVVNTAYIYFDYNAPVITNTTMNIIAANSAGISPAESSADVVRLYPNPTTGLVQVQLPEHSGAWTIEVTDIAGRSIQRQMAGGAQCTIHLEGIPGLYFIRTTSIRTGKMSMQKVVLAK